MVVELTSHKCVPTRRHVLRLWASVHRLACVTGKLEPLSVAPVVRSHDIAHHFF